MRDQHNPLSRHTHNLSCDDGRLPLVEGAGGEPAAEEPAAEEPERRHEPEGREQRAAVGSRAPGLDWSAFFSGAGLEAQNTFVVWQPGAVTGISALAREMPLATWKDYLAFHFVSDHATFLPKAFDDAVLSLHEFAGKNWHLQPEKRLMLAVLEDAVGTFQKYASAPGRREQRPRVLYCVADVGCRRRIRER